jgi:hypothetical protein
MRRGDVASGSMLIAAILAVMLGGCALTASGNAVLGPNPGGGFYCPHNIYEGCAYP